MKQILFILAIGLTLSIQAQTNHSLWLGTYQDVEDPCGTWQPNAPTITPWKTVDTIGPRRNFDTAMDWVETAETRIPDGQVAMFFRCGVEPYEKYYQYRISSTTGIIQQRFREVTYRYIAAPPSRYRQVYDSLFALDRIKVNLLDNVTGIGVTTRNGDTLTILSSMAQYGCKFLNAEGVWIDVPCSKLKKKKAKK